MMKTKPHSPIYRSQVDDIVESGCFGSVLGIASAFGVFCLLLFWPALNDPVQRHNIFANIGNLQCIFWFLMMFVLYVPVGALFWVIRGAMGGALVACACQIMEWRGRLSTWMAWLMGAVAGFWAGWVTVTDMNGRPYSIWSGKPPPDPLLLGIMGTVAGILVAHVLAIWIRKRRIHPRRTPGDNQRRADR
jgi:hypothetical protein